MKRKLSLDTMATPSAQVVTEALKLSSAGGLRGFLQHTIQALRHK
jgi:hypothetical protein